MTRKKFINKVMSNYIQRNEAAELADLVTTYGSYDKLYDSLSLYLAIRKSRKKGEMGLKTISKVLSESLTPVITAFTSALHGFLSSFSEAIKEYDQSMNDIAIVTKETPVPVFQFESVESINKLKEFKPEFNISHASAYQMMSHQMSQQQMIQHQRQLRGEWEEKQNLKDEEDLDWELYEQDDDEAYWEEYADNQYDESEEEEDEKEKWPPDPWIDPWL